MYNIKLRVTSLQLTKPSIILAIIFCINYNINANCHDDDDCWQIDFFVKNKIGFVLFCVQILSTNFGCTIQQYIFVFDRPI